MVVCSGVLLLIDFTLDSSLCGVAHRSGGVNETDTSSVLEDKNLCWWLYPFQTGLYHDQRNYTSLTKTKPPPLLSTSTYHPRVGPPVFAVQLSDGAHSLKTELAE